MHEDIIELMRRRFQHVKRQRQAALATAEDLLQEMNRVRESLQLLTGEELEIPAPPVQRKPARPARGGSGPGSLNLDEVRRAVQELLAGGPQGRLAIRDHVREIASARGLSRRGLHFTIAHALEREEFEESEEGWRLRADSEIRLPALVRRLLREDAMTQAQLQKTIEERSEEIATDARGVGLELRLAAVLREGPFELSGSKWKLVDA